MIIVNIRYTGEGDNAIRFAREMTESGTVKAIREKEGNIRYEYFIPLEDEHTVLLIDAWKNQEAIDEHHQSPMMNTIAQLREKNDLTMKVERYQVTDDEIPESDRSFIRE